MEGKTGEGRDARFWAQDGGSLNLQTATATIPSRRPYIHKHGRLCSSFSNKYHRLQIVIVLKNIEILSHLSQCFKRRMQIKESAAER